MKSPAQTKDGAIDNLLRAYVSRPNNPHQACPEFDPDQANAYIERGLTASARTRYEQHLSECAPCRRGVVALMRLAEADSPATISAVRQPVVATSRWLDGVRRILGTLAQPRWAMAAAAILVAAISLPLILSRNQVSDSPSQAVDQVADSRGSSGVAPGALQSEANSAKPATPVSTISSHESAPQKALMAKNEAAQAATADSRAGAAGADLSRKAEAKPSPEPTDEAKLKTESQVAAAPPVVSAAPGSQAKSDSDQSRQQQSPKDVSQQTTETKTVARSDEERAKERGEQAQMVAAPPAPRAAAEEPRRRSGFRRALRDANTEAVKPEERKFSGKKFLFKDGSWTDKDFDPDKDLPSVTIIRDSNVYNEVINKHPGLKPFLTGFHASERAIIVYKGTVYRLIPQ